MAANLLNTTLQYLQRHPTQNMYSREMVGDIIPHIAIARNQDERIDTSVIQLTNTVFPVVAGYSLDPLFNFLQKRIQPLTTPLSKEWFILGKSLALFGFLASIPIANAFIRNWVTMKRTGSTGFIDMVGEKEKSKLTSEKQQELQNNIKSQERKILSILGTGALISASLFGLTQMAIRGKWAFGKIPKLLSQFLGLPNGKFEQFAQPARSLFGKIALPPILFWGIPIYAGLFSASRDKFEFKELILRFGTFLLSFFILPRLAKDAITNRMPAVLKPLLSKTKYAPVLVELVTTSILFAVLPPLVNIYLTKQRVKKEDSQKSQQNQETQLTLPSMLKLLEKLGPGIQNNQNQAPQSPFIQQPAFPTYCQFYPPHFNALQPNLYPNPQFINGSPVQ